MSNELWSRTEPTEKAKSVTFRGPDGFKAKVDLAPDERQKSLDTLDTAIIVLNNMWGVEE